MDNVKFETYDMFRKDNFCISFLYNTLPGRILLRLLILPIASKFFGFFMNSGASRFFIAKFVKKNNIDINEYKQVKYTSFNDFFTREIKDGFRPISPNAHDVVAPCDGKLTAYHITADSVFKIKNSVYDVHGLLQEKQLANDFINGICLIFRLMPDDYHRYCYIDDCEVFFRKNIKGTLHTVRPIALQKYNVYTQNSRDYVVLHTKNLGKVIQMEIGALFVGRIVNDMTKRVFKRGEEKGMFEFGGSTIVMLFQKDAIKVNNIIFENTQQNRETIVRMGHKIGEKL